MGTFPRWLNSCFKLPVGRHHTCRSFTLSYGKNKSQSWTFFKAPALKATACNFPERVGWVVGWASFSGRENRAANPQRRSLTLWGRGSTINCDQLCPGSHTLLLLSCKFTRLTLTYFMNTDSLFLPYQICFLFTPATCAQLVPPWMWHYCVLHFCSYSDILPGNRSVTNITGAIIHLILNIQFIWTC